MKATSGQKPQKETAVPYDAAAKLAYKNWINSHNKPYDAARYQIFKENYEAVSALNAAAKKKAREEGTDPYLLDLNEFADRTDMEPEHDATQTVTTGKDPLAIENSTKIDVSVPYDAAARLAYNEWIESHNMEYDEEHYQNFRENYEAITSLNMAAKKQARDEGAAPSLLDLGVVMYSNSTMLNGVSDSSSSASKNIGAKIMEPKHAPEKHAQSTIDARSEELEAAIAKSEAASRVAAMAEEEMKAAAARAEAAHDETKKKFKDPKLRTSARSVFAKAEGEAKAAAVKAKAAAKIAELAEKSKDALLAKANGTSSKELKENISTQPEKVAEPRSVFSLENIMSSFSGTKTRTTEEAVTTASKRVQATFDAPTRTPEKKVGSGIASKSSTVKPVNATGSKTASTTSNGNKNPTLSLKDLERRPTKSNEAMRNSTGTVERPDAAAKTVNGKARSMSRNASADTKGKVGNTTTISKESVNATDMQKEDKEARDAKHKAEEIRMRKLYDDWCATHGKTFDKSRFAIFAGNVKQVSEAMKKSGKPIKMNKYADRTVQEYKEIKQKLDEVKAAEEAKKPIGQGRDFRQVDTSPWSGGESYFQRDMGKWEGAGESEQSQGGVSGGGGGAGGWGGFQAQGGYQQSQGGYEQMYQNQPPIPPMSSHSPEPRIRQGQDKRQVDTTPWSPAAQNYFKQDLAQHGVFQQPQEYSGMQQQQPPFPTNRMPSYSSEPRIKQGQDKRQVDTTPWSPATQNYFKQDLEQHGVFQQPQDYTGMQQQQPQFPGSEPRIPQGRDTRQVDTSPWSASTENFYNKDIQQHGVFDRQQFPSNSTSPAAPLSKVDRETNRVRNIYHQWCEIHGKTPDDRRFKAFESNYKQIESILQTDVEAVRLNKLADQSKGEAEMSRVGGEKNKREAMTEKKQTTNNRKGGKPYAAGSSETDNNPLKWEWPNFMRNRSEPDAPTNLTGQRREPMRSPLQNPMNREGFTNPELSRMKSEADAKRKAEAELERIARERSERKMEEERRRKAFEEEVRRKQEDERRRIAEERAKLEAEAEAMFQAEAELERVAAEQARREAEEELRRVAEEIEAMRRAEEERMHIATEKARRAAEEEAKRRAEMEEARKAAEEAKLKAEEEHRRIAAEIEALRKAEEERIRVTVEQARLAAEAEAKRREEDRRERLIVEEAKRKAEEELRKVAAEIEAKKAEEAQRRAAAEKERIAMEAEAMRKAEEEQKRIVAEQARIAAEAEAMRQAQAERERIAVEEARRKAEEELRRVAAEIEAKKAEEEHRRVAAEQARIAAEAESRRRDEENRKRMEAEKARAAAEADARRHAEEEQQRAAAEHARIAAEVESIRLANIEQEKQHAAEAERRANNVVSMYADAQAPKSLGTNNFGEQMRDPNPKFPEMPRSVSSTANSRPVTFVQANGESPHSSNGQVDRVRAAYNDYCKFFGKQGSEERFKAFANNFAQVEQYHQKTGTALEMNEFSDLTAAEYMQAQNKRSTNRTYKIQTSGVPSYLDNLNGSGNGAKKTGGSYLDQL